MNTTAPSPRTLAQNERRERRATAAFGMWVFIASEMMFFGGLLFAYAYGRIRFPAGFAAAGRATDVVAGTVNTALLLSSSLAVALAFAAAIHRRAQLSRLLLLLAAALGIAFLCIKGLEYRNDWLQGLFPGPAFHLGTAHGGPPAGAELFYMLYFTTTGVHAVHLLIGIAWVCLLGARLPRMHSRDVVPRLEVAGLYWHFVDVVWIFLYPLLYLVGRAS